MPQLSPRRDLSRDDRTLLEMIFEGDPREDLLPFDGLKTRLWEIRQLASRRVSGIRIWFYALVLAPLAAAAAWTWWPLVAG